MEPEEPFPDDETPIGAATGTASRSGPPRHVARRRVGGRDSYLSEMRRHEAAQRRAAEAEMRAEGLDPETGESLAAPAAARSRDSRGSRALLSERHKTSLAQGVLGVIGYAIGINYLRGGWPQVKGWLAAKFANVPYTPSVAAAAPAPAATVTKLHVVRAPSSSAPGAA